MRCPISSLDRRCRRSHATPVPSVFAVALFAIAVLGVGCAASPEELALHARADSFGELMVDLRDMPPDRARRELRGFLEPTSDREARVESYLREASASSGKYRVVSSSVEGVKVTGDGTRGVVSYTMVAQGPGGEEIEGVQLTDWRLVDDTWYRTATEALKGAR